MDTKAFGAWASFSVQIITSVATVIWPEYKTLAWAIFVIASICLVVCMGLWIRTNFIFTWPLKRRGITDTKFPVWPDPYSPSIVSDRKFVNIQVQVDGIKYFNCTFDSVTFIYNGTTPIQFDKCKFGGKIMFASDNPACRGQLLLAYALGAMKPIELIGLDPAKNTINPLTR
jgi:hypothetical protein